MNGELKAFKCWVPRISNEGGIHLALTASKARYKCFLQAKDAGFDFITIPDIWVRRAPVLDGMDPSQSGWREELVDVPALGHLSSKRGELG